MTHTGYRHMTRTFEVSVKPFHNIITSFSINTMSYIEIIFLMLVSLKFGHEQWVFFHLLTCNSIYSISTKNYTTMQNNASPKYHIKYVMLTNVMY